MGTSKQSLLWARGSPTWPGLAASQAFLTRPGSGAPGSLPSVHAASSLDGHRPKEGDRVVSGDRAGWSVTAQVVASGAPFGPELCGHLVS